MKLSVVIPCYNAAATIGETLDALAGQRWSEPWEILVVNNRSTDHSMQIVEAYQKSIPNLRTVDACDRQGQPHALNVGVQGALGEAIALCDADDVAGEGWVAAMGEALAHHDFVACRMETEKLNRTWVCLARGRPQCDGLQNYKYPPYLPHASGGTIGFKRTLCTLYGGFDEETFRILHDTDFCWRLQRAGVPLHFVPEAVMHVRFRSTLRGMVRQAKGYGAENVLLYKRYRNEGMPRLAWKRGLREWVKLFVQLFRIRNKVALARWLWRWNWRVGRLQSSIEQRIFAL